MVNQAHSKWLKYTIQIHTGHLMSTPHCEELLGPVYSLIEARTRHYSMALQLKGKLDMMTRQITAKSESTDKDEITSREALLGKSKNYMYNVWHRYRNIISEIEKKINIYYIYS